MSESVAMAEHISIEVAGLAEARDLEDALAVRGLPCRVAADGLEVTLDYAHEPTERLLADLLPALLAWREDRGRGPVLVEVGQRSCVLSVDADVAGCVSPVGAPDDRVLTAA